MKYVEKLLRDVPLIRAWVESRVEAAARKPSSGIIIPSGQIDPFDDPVLDAVIELEEDPDYQYARRFLKYVDKLPSRVREFLRLRFELGLGEEEAACVVGFRLDEARAWMEKIDREVKELFPRHPLERS